MQAGVCKASSAGNQGQCQLASHAYHTGRVALKLQTGHHPELGKGRCCQMLCTIMWGFIMLAGSLSHG